MAKRSGGILLLALTLTGGGPRPCVAPCGPFRAPGESSPLNPAAPPGSRLPREGADVHDTSGRGRADAGDDDLLASWRLFSEAYLAVTLRLSEGLDATGHLVGKPLAAHVFREPLVYAHRCLPF